MAQIKRSYWLQRTIGAALMAFAFVPGMAFGQKLTTLVNFDGNNGASPNSNLVADRDGNLIGTTLTGGTNGNGVVFEIKKKSKGYDNSAIVLYDCTDTYGSNLAAPMMVDAEGNLI